MRIALDYEGVVSMGFDEWKALLRDLKRAGHQVFLISHAVSERDAEKRSRFALEAGIADCTFVCDPSREEEVRNQKAHLARSLGIDLFVEDSPDRAFRVALGKPDCVCVYVPRQRWQMGLRLLRGVLG